MNYLHRSVIVIHPKWPLKIKVLKEPYMFYYVLALVWKKQQLEAGVTQEQQEIFLYDILRPMTIE